MKPKIIYKSYELRDSAEIYSTPQAVITFLTDSQKKLNAEGYTNQKVLVDEIRGHDFDNRPYLGQRIIVEGSRRETYLEMRRRYEQCQRTHRKQLVDRLNSVRQTLNQLPIKLATAQQQLQPILAQIQRFQTEVVAGTRKPEDLIAVQKHQQRHQVVINNLQSAQQQLSWWLQLEDAQLLRQLCKESNSQFLKIAGESTYWARYQYWSRINPQEFKVVV